MCLDRVAAKTVTLAVHLPIAYPLYNFYADVNQSVKNEILTVEHGDLLQICGMHPCDHSHDEVRPAENDLP